MPQGKKYKNQATRCPGLDKCSVKVKDTWNKLDNSKDKILG